jgi:hypothetical protein
MAAFMKTHFVHGDVRQGSEPYGRAGAQIAPERRTFDELPCGYMLTTCVL